MNKFPEFLNFGLLVSVPKEIRGKSTSLTTEENSPPNIPSLSLSWRVAFVAGFEKSQTKESRFCHEAFRLNKRQDIGVAPKHTDCCHRRRRRHPKRRSDHRNRLKFNKNLKLFLCLSLRSWLSPTSPRRTRSKLNFWLASPTTTWGDSSPRSQTELIASSPVQSQFQNKWWTVSVGSSQKRSSFFTI